MIDFVAIIGQKYPNVQVSCFGSPDTYSNLVWESGDPLPSEATLTADWLAYCQDVMWKKIKAERDDRKADGIQVGSFWFHSDDASRIQQIALTMLGSSLPAGIMWKTLTGEFTEMTATLASQIFQMNIYYDKMNFANAETHRQNMLASSDPLSYDFSSGWQLSFEDAYPALAVSEIPDEPV